MHRMTELIDLPDSPDFVRADLRTGIFRTFFRTEGLHPRKVLQIAHEGSGIAGDVDDLFRSRFHDGQQELGFAARSGRIHDNDVGGNVSGR